MCVLHFGLELCALQVGVLELCVPQVGALELCVCQVGTLDKPRHDLLALPRFW